MLGLGKKETKVKNTDDKKQDKQVANTSQSDEAKAILAKLEAKKAANPDDCVFC